MRKQDQDHEAEWDRDYHDEWQGDDLDCNIDITNDIDDYHLVVSDSGFEETLKPDNQYYRPDQKRFRSRQPADWIEPKDQRNKQMLELMSDRGWLMCWMQMSSR